CFGCVNAPRACRLLPEACPRRPWRSARRLLLFDAPTSSSLSNVALLHVPSCALRSFGSRGGCANRGSGAAPRGPRRFTAAVCLVTRAVGREAPPVFPNLPPPRRRACLRVGARPGSVRCPPPPARRARARIDPPRRPRPSELAQTASSPPP